MTGEPHLTPEPGMTVEKLRAMLREIHQKYPPPEQDPLMMPFLRPRFAGLDIIERPPPRPKIQVRDDLDWMTPEFRADMNAWLIAQFGFEREDPNMYRFSHYLSVPLGISYDLRRIVNTGNLA